MEGKEKLGQLGRGVAGRVPKSQAHELGLREERVLPNVQ